MTVNDNQKGIRPTEVSTNKIRDLIKASYQRNTGARDIGKKYGLTLDDSFSNAERKVYTDKEGHPSVVYTGSRKVGDWMTNALLATGLEGYSTRFRDAKKVMEDVKKKYGKAVTTYGHSLGGSLAEYAGGNKVITVDKGVGLGGIGKKLRSQQTDIRAGSDIVSALRNTQSGGRKVVIKNTNYLNPLKSHNYRLVSRSNQSI